MATLIGEMPADLLRQIQLVVTDVDGVLTNGVIGITAVGVEFKMFDVKDGAGFVLWRAAGGLTAFLSGRGGDVISHRAEELKVNYVVMNSSDKLPRLHEICAHLNVPIANTLYVGDDIPDIPCLRAAGIGVAVADATSPTLAAAKAVTSKNGGHGAVREIFDALLAARTRQ